MGGISKRVRFEVFKRDDFTCVYCGRTPPESPIECDHVIAASSGGSCDLGNLVTACADCNRGKSNIPVDNRIALQRERKMRDREAMFAVTRYWERVLESGSYEMSFTMPQESSIRSFVRSLSIYGVFDAIDKTRSVIGVADFSLETKESHDVAYQTCGDQWQFFQAVCLRAIDSKAVSNGR